MEREMTEETKWEKKFWGTLNPICLNCRKDCKQSAQVELVECLQKVAVNKKQAPNHEIDTIIMGLNATNGLGKDSKRTKFGHRVSGITGKMDLLLMDGRSKEEIAKLLGCTVAYVELHITHLAKEHNTDNIGDINS